MDASDRGRLLYKLADLLEENQSYLAVRFIKRNPQQSVSPVSKLIRESFFYFRALRLWTTASPSTTPSTSTSCSPSSATGWQKKAKLNSFIRFAILLLCQTRYFAGWADKNYGQTIPIDGPYFSMTRQDIDTTDLFALISLSHSHKNN